MTDARIEVPLPADTGIGWWDENRRRFNGIADLYNAWLMSGRDGAVREVLANTARAAREELEDSPITHGALDRMIAALDEETP